MNKLCAILRKPLIQWIVYAGGSLLIGGIGGLLGGTSGFETLNRPPLTPPAWVFPVVWSLLYVLMGTAAYLISKITRSHTAAELKLYWFQLVVNALWPLIFFRLSWRLFAFVWLIVLLFAVIILTMAFYRKRKGAGYLLLPYIAWLLFAGYLNFGFYILN